MSKKYFQLVFCFFSLILMTVTSFAATKSSDDVWQEVTESELSNKPLERLVKPSDYKTFRINKDALKAILNKAPMEFTDASRNEPVFLMLPMPDGKFARFRIEYSPIMEEGLAVKYPEIKTYRGYGIDDPTASVRFDLMPSGFHSMILSANGTVLVDPYAKGDTENYVTYFKKNVTPTGKFYCEFDENKDFEALSKINGFDPNAFLTESAGANVISGTQLRTYRLAVAATGEYTTAVGGGTVAGALAAQVLIMNRVNGVYERDVAIRMVIVANNDLIIYTDGTTDPYTNNNGSTLLGENQTNINTVIGTANYDIGHVFSTGGGGVASLGVPCGANKARGVTGLSNPVGDPFAIDYVAHEMGHQWGANHTFNGAVSNCSGGNRSSGSAYEPGSGVTIMAYAGICGNQNLSGNSIDTFHVRSLEVIVNYSQTGNGNACATTTSTGNTPPTVPVTGGSSFNIPRQTPFALTASATDADGDSLTYDWQEYDLGASTTAVPNTDSDGTVRPIFRPYLPTTGGTRTFPSLQYILNNANVPPSTTGSFLTGELLPAITRTMNFQVVARDNRANGGGINTATTSVIVDVNSGPFAVTSPNTNVSVAGGTSQTITWNVANTTVAPVSATNVRISLSTDGGNTFPFILRGATANDGSESISIPVVETNSARIKIEAVGNIFFDISDANFSITTQPTFITKPFFDFDGDNRTDVGIFRPAVGQWWYRRSSDGQVPVVSFGQSSDRIVAADFTGDGRTDIAVFRPSTGLWFILRSEDSAFYSFPFGSNGDIPTPADFNGDGKADPAVFRPSTSTWYIQNSGGGTTITPFGTSGDLPVAADYDGDNRADIGIFRPSSGQWWINRSTAGLTVTNFGTSTDRTVQADYTGDGRTDIAVWRPSTGQWFVLRSEDSAFYAAPFGTSGDSATPGDYDGDGRSDFAVFRSSNNTWYLQQSTSGLSIFNFGTTNDIPLSNAYVR